MVNIIFNASNYDRNSKKYKKEFSTNQTLHDMKVSLTSLSLYNSFFNVSAANSNNVINIKFLGTTYSTTLEDGYYSVSDLNYAMQNLMIENGLYIKSGTTNIFFIELVTNSVRYSIQLNSYLIPTILRLVNWDILNQKMPHGFIHQVLKPQLLRSTLNSVY